VFRDGDPPPFGTRIPLRRGVVHARVEAPGIGAVDVLVAHFKSSRPVPARDASGRELAATSTHMRAEAAARSLVWRTAEALFVRDLVDRVILPADAERRVAVVGDLNDLPSSTAVRTVRGEGDGELFDCAAGVDERARFSTLHEGRPSQIDHVLASAALYARLQAAHFLNAGLHEHMALGGVAGDPERGGRGAEEYEELPTVDSDHAPLVTRFG